MAVMAEYLVRGWNVAIPEVDIGDDIFVVRDSDGNLSRIQVKTASAQERANGYSAKFSLSLTQLTRFITPDLSYIFVVRRNHRWESFVVIDRDALKEESRASQRWLVDKGQQTDDSLPVLGYKGHLFGPQFHPLSEQLG